MSEKMKPASLEANDLFSVKGLVAVVTGGGTGIGLMIAQGLETNGAIVYITGRRQEVLDKAVKTAKHGNIHAIQADVTKRSSLEKAVSEIKSKHGFVNAVIANAGVMGSVFNLPPNASIDELRRQLSSVALDDFHQTYSVNVTGVYNTVVEFLELLDAGNKKKNVPQNSQVIAISSIAGYSRGLLGGFSYATSKAALNHMMKQFATVLGPHGIRANVIAPGPYPSEMSEALIETVGKSGGWEKDVIPLQRSGDIQDMAGAALFLLSRAGAYITGDVLVTDGGMVGTGPSTY